MKSIVILLAFLLASRAHAYKLLLLTDEPGAVKARAIKALITSTSPFKSLAPSELTVEIESVPQPVSCHSKFMKYTASQVQGLALQLKREGQRLSNEQREKYRKGFSIDRLVECDRQQLASIGANFGANRVLFVHQSPFEGGSGGDIPIVLAGSSSGVGMHEWLHTLGLADEYAYSEEEANVSRYCARARWINIAVFEPRSYYTGNSDVIASHSDEISWLSGLPKAAQLTTSNRLGSPKGSGLGIFPAKTCNNLTPSRSSWHASSYPSIMENQNVPYVPKPWWPALLSVIGVSSARVQSLMASNFDPAMIGVKVLKSANLQPRSGESVQ